MRDGRSSDGTYPSDGTARSRRRPSPQSRALIRRAVLVHASVLGVGLLLAVLRMCLYVASQRGGSIWLNPLTGHTTIEPFPLDVFVMRLLFVCGVVWYVGSFDGMLCHGVARRSFAAVSAVASALAALTAALVAAPVLYSDMAFGRMLLHRTPAGRPIWADGWLGGGIVSPRVSSFVNTWTGFGASGVNMTDTSVQSAVRDAGPTPFLLTCVILLAMTVTASAAGMLAGAVFVWALDGGPRRLAGTAAFLLAFLLVGVAVVLPWLESMRDPSWAGWKGVLSPLWIRLTSGDSPYSDYDVSHMELAMLYAWLPLVEAMALFALCAWATRRLAMVHETRPVRFAVAAGGKGKGSR